MIGTGEIIRAGPRYLGTAYSKMDCQAFVEKCLADAGIKKNLAGSNAWYREVMRNGWVGTPDECRKKYGSIPPGAFLFVLKQDGKEPEKYKGDGIGNANHIGIYTGMTGAEMCAMSGKPDAGKYNFGDGAINSSYTHGCVCTSKFAGKAISGGWNRIGLWTSRIKYFGDEETEMKEYRAEVIGGTLNMRKAPVRSAAIVSRIPSGSFVTVTEETADGWSKITWDGKTGYVMSEFLKKTDDAWQQDKIEVNRAELQQIYDWIGKILKG